MAENTIDTLELQISSTADQAVKSIDNMSRALRNVNSTLSGLNSQGLRSYAKGIGQVTAAIQSLNSVDTGNIAKAVTQLKTLSNIDFSKFENRKLKIDVEIAGGDAAKKMQYAIEKSLEQTKIDTSSISSQLISAFDLKGGAASRLRKQMQVFAEQLTASFNGQSFDAGEWGKTLDQIGADIVQSGKTVKSELGSYLAGTEQEWVDFYNYFKNKKIYVSDMLKNDVGKSEYQEILKNSLGNITVDPLKGIDLNKSWSELADRFPTLISEDTVNQAEQLISVLETLKKVRDQVKPIDIQSLSGSDLASAQDKVFGSVTSAAQQVGESIGKNIQNAVKTADGQLPIDIKINQDKIVNDIKNAISKASSMTYDPVKVNLDVNTKDIKDAISQKLSGIDAGQLPQVSDGLEKINSALQSMAGIDLKSTGINATINALQRLSSTDLSNFDVTKLSGISDVLSRFSNIPDISSSVNRLVSSLVKLAASGESIGTVTSNLPLLGDAVSKFIANASASGMVSKQLDTLVQSLAKLATAGNKTGQTASQLGSLTSAVLSFFNTMKDAPEISSNTIRMTEALAQLATTGSRTNSAINAVSGGMGRLTNASKGITGIGGKIRSAISGAGNSLLGFSDTASTATKRTNSLVSQLTSLYIKFFTLKRIVNALWKSVSSASDYVETLNYFNSAFNQVTEGLDISAWKDAGVDSAEEYVGSFEKRAKELTKKLTGFEVSSAGDLMRSESGSLGLNPNDTMNYQATYAQMSSSMGATADTATKLSQALTEIGSDLASVKNLDFNDVWQDMASGLTGMSRALDKYGINIRVANLQQELYNLGIDTSVSKLNQTDKAILRTITILNSSKYAWADLASTINQPANQVRMLKSNFEALARSIGTLLLPIVAKVLPYLNGIVIAVERVFSGLARLLGIKLSDYVSSTKSASVDMDSMADASDNAASGLGNADKNAKKLKKSLSVLPFDELNQLNSDKNSKGKSSSGSGGATPHIPALDDALADAISNYQKVWDEAFGSMENKAQQVADKITDAFEKVRKAAKPTTDAIKKLWNEGLSKLGNFSINALKNLWKNYLKPMGNWALSDNSGLPRFFKITNDILNKINWSKLQTVLKNFFEMLQKPTKFVWTGLMDFYENFLKPISVWTMNEAIPRLVDALTAFGNAIHWDELNAALSEFWKALAPFAKNVGEGLVAFFEKLLKVGADFINDKLPNGLKSITDALKNIDPETAKEIGAGLGKISLAIVGFKGLTFIEKIIGEGSPLAKGLSRLAKHPYAAMALGLSGIVVALDNFGVIDVDWDWISSKVGEIKTAISDFIDKVDWDSIGTSVRKFSDAFSPFVAGFADSLIDGLKGLLNLGADLLNGIGDAIGWLGDALGKVDPEILKKLGNALGTFVEIKLTFAIISKLTGLAGSIVTFGNALGNGTVAANTSTFAKALTVLKGAVTGLAIGMALTEETVGEAKDVDGYGQDMEKGFSYLSAAVEDLGAKAGVSDVQMQQLNNQLQSMKDQGLIYDPSALQNFADKLSDAGIKAEDLKDSALNTSEVVDQLRICLEDSEKSADFVGKNGFAYLSGALALMYQNGKISLDQYKQLNEYLNTEDGAKTAAEKYRTLSDKMSEMGINSDELYHNMPSTIESALNLAQTSIDNFNVSPVVEGLQSLTSEAQKVEFANLITESANAIDGMGGIWENGKQVLGTDALAIYNAIQDGLEPDKNGYYNLGNGQMVQYGNSIKDNKEPIKSTLDDTLKSILTDKDLMGEGHSLMLDMAGYHIDGYVSGMAGTGYKEVKKAYQDTFSIDQDVKDNTEKDGKSLAQNTVAGYTNYLKKDGTTNTSLVTEQWAKQGIIDPAENKLEIHSPSKLFARYAEYVEQGFSDKIKSLSATTAATMNTWMQQGIINPVVSKLQIEKGTSQLANAYGITLGKGMSSGILETKGVSVDAVDTVVSAMKAKMQKYVDNNTFAKIGEKYMSSLKSGILDKKSSVLSAGSVITDALKSDFGGMGSTMFDFGQNMAQQFVNGMNTVHFPQLKYRISSWTQHWDGSKRMADTPVYSPEWFAKGGLFNGAQVIGVGEAGREAVLPLENRRTMGMIADSIVSNSENSMGLTKDEMVQAVAQGVAMAMMNNTSSTPKYIMNSIYYNGREIIKAVTEAENDINYRLNPSPAY